MGSNNISDNDVTDLELGRIIARLYRQGRWYMDQRMASFGLGSGQHIFLFHLYRHNGTSQDELTRALELDKATTARALQKLEEKGYVNRLSDEKDKRINRVYLTEQAYAIQEELQSFSKEWQSILVSDLTSDELVDLKYLIEKIAQNGSTYKKQAIKKGGQHDK